METTASALPLGKSVMSHNTAHNAGIANPAQQIAVTLHLKRPNQTLFAKMVDALYDRKSPNFHHWMTDAQLRQFGPTSAHIATVRAELVRDGLSVAGISRDGTAIRAVGPLGTVSRAFHTEIHQFNLNGQTFRANIRPATLSGTAGSYVSLVSGLESHTVRPMLRQAIDLHTMKPLAAVPLNTVLASGGLSSIITDQIFGPKQSFTVKTNGELPSESFSAYTFDPESTRIPDYTPSQLQKAIGMIPAYKWGLTGAGQTIVLLEGYGYPTMLADANAFAKLTGLPPLNATNFAAVYPLGVADPRAGYATGWNIEIALDIDWAHAIAPGAKIVVVASNGQDSQDFEASMQYIIDNHLGDAVSDSWEEDTDLLAGPAEQEPFEDVLTTAAAKGISFNFSTGDSGDNGIGSPLGSAGVPSVAPHATAIGGTSIGNVPGTNSFVTTGWGDTLDIVAGGNQPLGSGSTPFGADSFYLFLGGGGGGQSTFWPKPAWQAALAGYYRQTPDVSALADPFTGVPIVTSLSPTGPQLVEPGWGGTSLASPIFTAIWAIANQRAGHSLGQAAPTIAGLKSGVLDVAPIAAPFTASYTTTKGTTKYTAGDLFASFIAESNFANRTITATYWNQPQFGQGSVFAFGFDTSLTVTPGWDNVTGYGTPTGLDFINAAASY